MARLSTATLLVVAACQRTPPRIYTDKEIADLEAQVMAKVAEVDASCSKPELLEFLNSPDDACLDAYMHTKVRANIDSNEVAAVDELCGTQVLEAFGRASLVSPSCSPFQVGVRAVPGIEKDKLGRGDVAPIHLAMLLSAHAQRELDAYVGITELLVGARVFQDLARGRIDNLQLMFPTTGEGRMIATSEKLLARSSMTKEQLDDIAATIDALIAAEPRFGDVLQGQSLHTALDYGVAGLKPPDWQPPGGRSDMTNSNARVNKSEHDRRDDAAHMMAAGLRYAELYAKACPSQAALATCYANLPKSPDEKWDPHIIDKHAARVGAFPDDETRHDSQKQLLDALTQGSVVVDTLQDRAVVVSHLVALRIHVQVLRDGRCPSEAQLSEPPYSTLRAPAVLGDTVLVSRTEEELLVDAPTWATTEIPKPEYMTKPPFPPPFKKPPHQPAAIACP